MTTYDGAMVVLVVAGMVWGAWRGITWQLASIVRACMLLPIPLYDWIAARNSFRE